MANLKVLDGDAAAKYLKSTGAGTDGDPHIPQHLETNSAAIKAAVELIDDAIAGTEMQVDVVASLPAGDNNIGNVDVVTMPTVTVADGGGSITVDAASLPLPTGAATAANQSTLIGHVDGIETVLGTIDADTSALAAIDYATGADVAALGVVGGGAEATALRVTIANNSTGVVSVDDNGGSLTVDAASLPLPTGAATAANQSTIIGHVDGIEGLLGTIDADTSALAAIDYATGADVAALGVVGGGLEATALRVTLANDSTGVVSVDDGGGSLTVDGTVAVSGTVPVSAASLPLPSGAATAANQSTLIGHVDGIETLLTGIDADTDAIKTAVQVIDNAIAGSEMQVDVVTLPALAAGTNNIGDVDVLTLPALAAGTNNIGDVDVASLPNTILSVVSGTAATSGNNTLIAAPGASNYISIFGIFIQNESSTATTAILTDGAGGSQLARSFGQNQGDGLSREMPAGTRIRLTANTALVLNLSGANSHGYTIYYTTGTS